MQVYRYYGPYNPNWRDSNFITNTIKNVNNVLPANQLFQLAVNPPTPLNIDNAYNHHRANTEDDYIENGYAVYLYGTAAQLIPLLGKDRWSRDRLTVIIAGPVTRTIVMHLIKVKSSNNSRTTKILIVFASVDSSFVGLANHKNVADIYNTPTTCCMVAGFINRETVINEIRKWG
ncbi:MAG: hypothetical protein WAX77_08840 [Methylococcaceae bacterium]